MINFWHHYPSKLWRKNRIKNTVCHLVVGTREVSIEQRRRLSLCSTGMALYCSSPLFRDSLSGLANTSSSLKNCSWTSAIDLDKNWFVMIENRTWMFPNYILSVLYHKLLEFDWFFGEGTDHFLPPAILSIFEIRG